MTEAQKKNDATRWLVVELGVSPKSMTILAVEDNEAAARKAAEDHAQNSESGLHYGVYQKTGTAKIERKVAWKGAAG